MEEQYHRVKKTTNCHTLNYIDGVCSYSKWSMSGGWLKNILKHIGCDQRDGTILLCDNNSEIKLSKNPLF